MTWVVNHKQHKKESIMEWLNNLDVDNGKALNGARVLGSINSLSAVIKPLFVVNMIDGEIVEIPGFDLKSWIEKGNGTRFISARTVM